MSTTTAPTVRAALIAAIDARPAMNGVLVTHVWQGDNSSQEQIYLGRTTGSLDFATIRAGRRTRDEEYTVAVIIDVTTPAGWDSSSEVRAYALAADIENMLADDATAGLSATIPTLRVLVRDVEQISGALDPGGVGTRITLTLQVNSRLN